MAFFGAVAVVYLVDVVLGAEEDVGRRQRRRSAAEAVPVRRRRHRFEGRVPVAEFVQAVVRVAPPELLLLLLLLLLMLVLLLLLVLLVLLRRRRRRPIGAAPRQVVQAARPVAFRRRPHRSAGWSRKKNDIQRCAAHSFDYKTSSITSTDSVRKTHFFFFLGPHFLHLCRFQSTVCLTFFAVFPSIFHHLWSTHVYLVSLAFPDLVCLLSSGSFLSFFLFWFF